MKYMVEIELSCIISVEAENEEVALEIADNLGIDDIRDYLLNYNTEILDISSDSNSDGAEVFTLNSIS